MTQIRGESQSAVWQVPRCRTHCSQWIIQPCIRARTPRTRERTQMHPHWLTICFTMPPGNGNGSGSVSPGQWTFFSPFSSCFFFVFLFLLPDHLVSWPFRLHGCISLGHEPLPFCRTLSLPLHFLHSSLFVRSAFLRSRQGCDAASPRAGKALFYRVKSRWWTSFPTSSTYRDLPRFR